MILIGNQRGGAKDLALHLLKEENDHVAVHELRGFMADNLMGALNETYAISRATRCKQFLFSLSLNPPQQENVPIHAFEQAIEKVEAKLGLTEQPRAIVFHEKQGRRHCHAVWSRIDSEEMKAIQLSFSKRKLMAVSRELFLEHGWTLPKGLRDPKQRDPRNFSLAEWQQAKRTGNDARTIKAALQEAWKLSDSKQAFIAALQERGFQLAKGDRRAFVAVDRSGEIYALPKWLGLKTKQVRDRLGAENAYPSIAECQAAMAHQIATRLKQLKSDFEQRSDQQQAKIAQQQQRLIRSQRQARLLLKQQQQKRWQAETRQRQARFRAGLQGIWDRLSGNYARIKHQNEHDALQAYERDRAETDQLIFQHLQERRILQQERQRLHDTQQAQQQTLSQDIAQAEAQCQRAKNNALERSAKKQRSRKRDHSQALEP